MAWTDPASWTVSEQVTAAKMNTHVRDNLNALDRAAPWIVHIGATPFERWYPLGAPSFGVGGGNFSVGTFSLGQLIALPFASPRGATIDRLAFEVTVGGGAGAKARTGIYQATSATNIYPSALIVDGGEFDTTTTGVKAATVSVTLEPDILYWAVFLSGTAAPTIRRLDITGVWLGVPSTMGANAGNGVQVAQAYGALPNPYTAGGIIQSATQPLVAARYSA